MLRVPIIDRPSGFPAGRKREPFSMQDDKLLVEYLATENPSGEHRKGNELWKRLEQNVGNKWPRGPAHTAQSWRNRYVNDSAGFDARVAAYIEKNRPKRKAGLWLETGDAKRRKLLDGQREQGRGGVTVKTEPEPRPMSAAAGPSVAETVANGHSSTGSRTKTPPIAEAQVVTDGARMAPVPSASAAGSSAVQALPPLRSLSATVAKRPALAGFHGARKTVSQVPVQATTSESSSSSRAASSSSLAGTSSPRSGTSGKDSDSRQSANVSTEHSKNRTASSASNSNMSRSRSASIHSQGSASSLRETMPGAFDAHTNSSHQSQRLYPKLSPTADSAYPASQLDAHENAHDGVESHEPGVIQRKRAEAPTHQPPTSSATAVQSSATGAPRRAVASARMNGSRAVRRSAQVYDDETEEDMPPAPAARKATTRVLITKDPFSNRRVHAGSPAAPVSSSSSGVMRHRDIPKPDVVKSDHKDDDDDMDYPVGPLANKGKGRAVEHSVTTGAQHEAANVPDRVAAPMKSHAVAESSPDSSPAAQSSPIERLLARSSSTVAAQQLSQRDALKRRSPPGPHLSIPKHLREAELHLSFPKPRDAPSPFTSPKSSAPAGPIFVRRSEARELVHPTAKSSPPRKPAYSLKPVPGKRRWHGGAATSAEDDTPTTNGRHMKQQAREFVVPPLPASISMPLPQAVKPEKAHRRRQTFGGYDVDLPDAGALLRSRERERRRSLRPSSGSPHPADEREHALRRMSANHGFAPAIVRGVLAGAREDVRAADAVLARMRREAEREAVRALGDIVGDEFEVETSPAPVDVASVPEVDFSSGPRRRRTSKWVASVAQEDEKQDLEPEQPVAQEDARMQDARALDPAQAPWTPEEDALILSGSPLKALKAIDARRGVGAVAARLAALL